MKLFNIFNKKSKYDFLNKIEGVTLYTGLSNDEINELDKLSKEHINFELTDDIKLFFSVTNGLYFDNGTTFYSKFNSEIKDECQGIELGSIDIVKHNEEYRELTDIDEFFILGEDSISYFVYNYSNNKYCVLSNGVLDIMNEYETLDVMVKEILTGRIYS